VVSEEQKKYRVVLLGGGSGAFSILRGLKKFTGILNLTSICTISDSGGSSGTLRSEYGILPPGDLRRHIAALSESSKEMVQLLNYRFKKENSLGNHTLGNLIYTALVDLNGGDEGAIWEMNRIFQTNKSTVLPASLDKVHLCAIYEDGTMIREESNIDTLRSDKHGKIIKVYLEPPAIAYTKAMEAIEEATHIILSAGDLYTSIIPILLIRGIPEAIRRSRAKLLYVANIMTKRGETDGFTVEDFIRELERYLQGTKIDTVLVNKKRPTVEQQKTYREEQAEMVAYTPEIIRGQGKTLIEEDLLSESHLLRHEPTRTAVALIREILKD